MGKRNLNKSEKVKIGITIILILIILFLLFSNFLNIKYDIKFDSNGGTEVAPFIVEKNGLITEPKDPIREGFIFAGWYYNDELFDFSTPVKEDIELEARWVKLSDITGIKLSEEELVLKIGESYELFVTILPDGITSNYVIWKSSNESIVSIDEEGKVTAKAQGEALITAATKDGKHTATIKVIVSVDPVKVTGISLDKTNISLNVHESYKLTATINPENATNKGVTWSSSNPSVATVDANGNITALKQGTTTITVKTNDGSYTATANVKVSTVKVTGISLNKTSASLYVNENTKLSATIKPSNASNKGVTWISSNPSVATVDAYGNVKALSVGTAVITVKSNDGGYTASCTITVNKKAASYTIVIEKKVIDVINATYQYSISVTKDGSAFGEYTGISYNGYMIAKGQFLPSTQYNSGITSAKVYINGAPVNASVIYR